MRKFSEYIVIKEEQTAENTAMSFSKAEQEIKDIFGQLHKIMVNTWGKTAPSWSSQVKEKVISDLQNVISKLSGERLKESTDYAIREAILTEGNLPAWVSEVTGKDKKITVDRMLNAMMNQVIKILHQLRDETLVKQVSQIPGEISKVGHRLSKTIGKNVRGIGGTIKQSIESGVRVSPEITGEARSSAKYNLVQLYNVLQNRPNIKLYSGVSGTRQLKYDPSNEKQMTEILDKLNKGKNFRIRVNGKDHFFDITHEGDVATIIEFIKSQP